MTESWVCFCEKILTCVKFRLFVGAKIQNQQFITIAFENRNRIMSALSVLSPVHSFIFLPKPQAHLPKLCTGGCMDRVTAPTQNSKEKNRIEHNRWQNAGSWVCETSGKSLPTVSKGEMSESAKQMNCCLAGSCEQVCLGVRVIAWLCSRGVWV